MSLDDPSVELKRPSESEDAPSNGKKSKTEDPLVAANALASFARPSTEEEGSAAADTSPHSEDPPPDKGEEVIAQQVSDDDDTEATAGTESAASASDSASVAATAASRAIQDAMNTVKQEQHVLAEREEAVKRQRSKAARFCADSRARRRLRTMIFEQSADPATQQLQLTQLQHLQQSQIRNQARCLLHPLTHTLACHRPLSPLISWCIVAPHRLPFYASQQLQYGVGIARPAVGPILQTAQFATPMSYLQHNPAAGVSFPFFPDPVSTALQSLPPHGSLAWNPFAHSAMPIATPMTHTPLAHAPMGFPGVNAFLPQRGMARWVALGAAPAPAAFAPISPGFGSPPRRSGVFRTPVVLNGHRMQ